MTRNKFRKIFGGILIIAALVLTQIPTETAVATESTKSEFDISGTTLLKYTGTATTVSVPDSIKVISDEAFADNSTMTTLKLPASLEKISYAAFSGCSKLTSVSIPDNVEEIDTAAFCNCISLSSVSLGKSVKKLGTGVFTGCVNLSSISGNDYFICSDGVIYDKEIETLYEVLPKSMVKASASSNDYVLRTSYDMPDTVKSIKPYALYDCKNIQSVALSNNLSQIPAYSFSYCNGLKNIKIPYSVNLIDMKAFEYCINLEKVEIPVSVSFIHKTAFDGCNKLNIIAPVDSYAYNWYQNFDRSQVNIIDNEDNSESVSENEGYTRPPIDGLIGETIIVGRQAVFFIDSTDFTVMGNDPSLEDYSGIVSQMENVLQTETNGKGLSLPKFTVVDNKIAGKAFYGDTALTEYEIGEDIESIGDFAFARTNLTNIIIPDGVTHIGYGAFYHCDLLSTIGVPSSVTDIEPSAFANTRMMENWRLYGDSDFLIMGDGILVAYKGIQTKVTIPDTVKQIGPEAFKNHKELMEVSFPDTLVRVCEEAFYGCANLRTITGGMNLSYIDDRAFAGCPLNTIRLVDTVSTVGMGAFDLSGTSLGDAYKTVVFQGDVLPTVTYDKTTTRLTNDAYRIDSFEGVRVAIVNSESVNRVGTVLDREFSGFSGLICYISEENNTYFNGSLRIIDCTLTEEEAEVFSIPETVYIYGKGYNFFKDELNSVLSMAKQGAFYSDKDAPSTVSFVGTNDEYVLTVVKDETPNQNLKNAYIRIYGDTVPANLSTYSINLREKDNEVWLTKFGKQTLPVTLNLPNNIPTTNLHVICTDEDNQLEDLPFSVVDNNGKLCVNFEISHTGSYGLYSFNSTAVSLYNLDDSPDTGDPIHPKWFLVIGFLSIGAVLILYKDKEKIAKL